jgi:hypothetical protein
VRKFINALIYGAVMFVTVFLLVVIFGFIANVAYGFAFTRSSILMLLREASFAGALAGVTCSLLGYFNVHWKIGSK